MDRAAARERLAALQPGNLELFDAFVDAPDPRGWGEDAERSDAMHAFCRERGIPGEVVSKVGALIRGIRRDERAALHARLRAEGRPFVDRDDRGLYVGLPDGTTERASSPARALRAAREWFRRERDTVGITADDLAWLGAESPARG